MKHVRVTTLLVVYVALLGGWLFAGMRADSAPETSANYQSPAYEMQLPADIIEEPYFLDDGQSLVVFRNGDDTQGFQLFTMA